MVAKSFSIYQRSGAFGWMIVEHLDNEVVQIHGVMATLWGHRISVIVEKHRQTPTEWTTENFSFALSGRAWQNLNGTTYCFYDSRANHFLYFLSYLAVSEGYKVHSQTMKI